MTVYEMTDKVCKLSSTVDALVALKNRADIHGMDTGLIEQEIEELIRAIHDTGREFETECIAAGERVEKAAVCTLLSVVDDKNLRSELYKHITIGR